MIETINRNANVSFKERNPTVTLRVSILEYKANDMSVTVNRRTIEQLMQLTKAVNYFLDTGVLCG